MFAAIFGGAIAQIADGLIGRVTGLFETYIKKQITVEELRAGMVKALFETFSDIEKAHADALAKTFDSFMRTLAQSPMMQRAYVVTLLSQVLVLFWYQFVVPAMTLLFGIKYPSAGTTVEWAYLLIGLLCGAGPLVLRTGPGALNVDKFKDVLSAGRK